MTSDLHLVVTNISKRFAGIQALDRASLSVKRGSITSLIGPNGAGKSTLFDIITGFEAAESGQVEFGGKRITRLPAYRIARLGLIRTFQMTKVLTKLSVVDNLRLAARSHPGERLSGLHFSPESRSERGAASRPEGRGASRLVQARSGCFRLCRYAVGWAEKTPGIRPRFDGRTGNDHA